LKIINSDGIIHIQMLPAVCMQSGNQKSAQLGAAAVGKRRNGNNGIYQ
jgi:hypothetical protein